MGTFFPHEATSKGKMVNYLRATENHGDEKRGLHFHWSVVDSSLRGNVLYAVIENKISDLATMVEKETKRFIIIYVLQSKGGQWGYKPIDESMHPYYYDCPKKFFKMVPVACQEWRDLCIKKHDRAKVCPKVNEVWKVQSGFSYDRVTVERETPLICITPNGDKYRFYRSQLVEKV